MPIESIKKFEEANNISVDMYARDTEERVVLMRQSECEGEQEHVDFLSIECAEMSYYALIIDLGELLYLGIKFH